MVQQSIDFDAPYVRDCATSKQAAETCDAASYEALALRLFQQHKSLTDEELSELMGDYPSARPRRWGLVRKGLVKDSGQTRKNRAGRSMIVWQVCEHQNSKE